MATDIRTRFRSLYGAAPAAVVRSPYRVCPLGAHVDHQHGQVSAFALERSLNLAFRPRADSRVRLRSGDFEGLVTFDLADPGEVPEGWGAYVYGAAQVLGEDLRVGLEGLVQGELPVGGLSSSAALSTAALTALSHVNGLALEPQALIAAAHRIEREVIGLKSGILDQSANVLSRRGRLLWLDCLTLAHRLIAAPPAMPDFAVLVAHSGVTDALIGTGYNNRVAECRAAAQALLTAAGLAQPRGREPVLRDVPAAVFQQHGSGLDPVLRRRAAHFFGEAERVESGLAAFAAGDLAAFGALITRSGESSIVNYECGSPELITLYERLIAQEGVYGARFSGAGYRGACIALVVPEAAEEVAAAVSRAYVKAHPARAEAHRTFICAPGDGITLES